MKKFKTVEEYIAAQPSSVRSGLKKLRSTIKKNAPGADEVISYGMPGFKFHGMLVWYAAASEHFGLYPMRSGIKAFEKELEKYSTSAGTVRFPFGKPLPEKLIASIIKFRVKENLAKAQLKKPKKKK
ncbi:MAG TPA: DUF1801 domain-containing protein [Bacteroidia bacterium]|jgi:uncharacterized protein YdhG (YjbR/CyaY superfamily)